MKEYVEIIQDHDPWWERWSEKVIFDRPCKKMQSSSFKSVTNANGLEMCNMF